MKNSFLNKILFAILVVLLNTTNVVYASGIGRAALKTTAVKFILAMMVIVIFSIIIFAGLSLYNKFFVSAQIKDYEMNKHSLRTPRDEEEALVMFISKNRLK